MRLTIVFNLFLMVGLIGCASYRDKAKKSSVRPKKVERKARTPVKQTKTNDLTKGGNAVWHLVYPEIAELFLIHESGQTELIRIETKLSDIKLAPGSWKIAGLIANGHEFEPLEGGARFEFSLTEKFPSYVGSLFVQCPMIEAANMKEVRDMEFFNRFPFTSLHGTCELIVGNDYPKVRRAWSKLEKVPESRLKLGF